MYSLPSETSLDWYGLSHLIFKDSVYIREYNTRRARHGMIAACTTVFV